MSVSTPARRTGTSAQWLTQVPLLLSRHLWVWPLLGAVLLALVGFWVRSRVEGATRGELASRLQTLLNADIAALHLWFSEQEADARSFAADVRIQEAIAELAALDRRAAVADPELATSPGAKTLELYLKPLLEAQHYLDYVVIGADRRILASPHPRIVNRQAPPGYELFLEKALAGQVAVSRPFARELSISARAEGPTMFVAAPVKSPQGDVIAVLALRMKPEAEFTQIFSVARMGTTGEAYAFDRRGMMLTGSRFDHELKDLGLIPNTPEATACLNLRLVDPGPNLANLRSAGKTNAQPVEPGGPVRPEPRREGGRPRAPELPLTLAAAGAVHGESGYDVHGYRNYRGAEVVGAWAWLPEYGMGVATEVAAREAFQTLYLVRGAFLVLFVLLVLSAAGIFAFTLLVERLQSSVRESALTARRLGQYVLVQEIGRGSNGRVYRARHSLLRRPVAVKLLSPELTNASNVARFEQEAQLTSHLTHPNTVAIYDYGRTPEGLFYYAMEYLSGIDLHQLVRQYGPQPPGRVVHILRQLCGSLAEAHRVGLIHRDIKPANLVLTRRGGVCDVVKVLDFGLVTARHLKGSDTTTSGAAVGTPHFMSPEAVETPERVDARSDLYSVGAVGYWLVTGQNLFAAVEIEELLRHQVNTVPELPSVRLSRPVDPGLEQIIMACLAKVPAQRPANAEAVDQALAQCAAAHTWTAADAERWWQTHLPSFENAVAATMLEKTLVIAPREAPGATG
jgi:tRNA A-37 threonylcarbamoyl transferase component Bud32